MSLPSQDPIFRPNYYLSLMEFRELTLQRLKKFVDQKFFSSFDYLRGEQYSHGVYCSVTCAKGLHSTPTTDDST